jgi:small-conductance mechanosensitive channel
MNVQSFVDPIVNLIAKLPNAILSLVFGYLVVKVILVIINRVFHVAKITKGLRDVIMSMASVVLWVILVSIVARNLGLSQIATTISGSLIVLGFAIANGASSMTADILAGLMLAKDEDFKVGYTIKINDIEGVISKLDIRKVRIINKEGKIFVFANSVVEKGMWVLLSRD